MTNPEVEVVASFSGKINTGSYNQESPFFSAKAYCTKGDVDSLQKELYKICVKNYRMVEDAVNSRIKAKTMKDCRFYETEFGGQYPSVTSIINAIHPKEFNIPEDKLKAYGARGELAHYVLEKFIENGDWTDLREDPEVLRWLHIMQKFDITWDGDLEGFFNKHPHDWISSEVAVFNHLEKYAGRQDTKGVYLDLITLGDLKTGHVDTKECFKQLAAYAMCDGNEDVQQLAIYPVNGKTKQGYSKIITTTEIEKYYDLFLKDREEFKERYGI